MRLAGIPIESTFSLFGSATTGRELFRSCGTAGLEQRRARACRSMRAKTRIGIDLPSSFFSQFAELSPFPVPRVGMIPSLRRVVS